MIEVNPTDEMIRKAGGVMLMDSARNFYESVGEVTPGIRDRLTIIVDSTDSEALAEWRRRTNALRQVMADA